MRRKTCHLWRDRVPNTRTCSPGPLNPLRLGQPDFTGLPLKMSFPLKNRDGEGEGGWGKGRKSRRKLWVGKRIELTTGWHLKDGPCQG